MALGPYIKELRAKTGLSQGEIATRAQIDVTYLSKLENGHQRGSERVLRRLAEVLEVEPGTLLLQAGLVPTEMRSSLAPSLLADAAEVESTRPPVYPTGFVDRRDEMDRLRRLLEPPGAIVAVTGPPGIGKTRLLAEVARDGVGRDRPLLWITVRDDEAGRVEAQLAMARLPRGALLVLDDAERDLETCARVARRMTAAGVTVAATTRQPLGLYGEHHMRLPSLPVPDRHQRPAGGNGIPADLGPFQDQESVQLFLDRAALARPDFELDEANALAIFDLCRWLDGLPLAIELAALRLRSVMVADLTANIRSLMTWLTGNIDGVPDRHASLERAVGWSFDRLDEPARIVATRLSVFESSFDLGDAVSVAADDERLRRESVETTVMDLVDRSLLVFRENADGRAMYRWPRPIRQYASQRLPREEDRTATQDRYRSWIRQVVDSLEGDLPRLESEWERLAELSPELVSAVYGLPAAERNEAMNRIADALSKTVQFGNLAAHVSWFTERFSGGGPEVFREAGMLARIRGELAEAHRNFEQAYRIAVNNRDDAGQANAALDLAENAVDRGEYGEAEDYVDRAAGLYEKLEDERGTIEILNVRGKLRLETSDLLAAERLFSEALRRAEQVKDTRLVAYSHHNLGVCDCRLRRMATARGHLEISLRLREGMRNRRGVARVVEAYTLLESELGNHELVLQLLGAARQYRRSSGMLGVPIWWQQLLDDAEQEARVGVVGLPDAADELLQSGAALTPPAAGELAMVGPEEALVGPVPEPVAGEPLRRPIPSPHVDTGRRAGAVAEAAREQRPTALDQLARELVQSGGVAEALRRLHRAKLLALAEPIGERSGDLLSFAVDPGRYRGTVVPVFLGELALAEAIDRHPEWASRPVLEIRFETLRSSLARGETAVVNPWTSGEFRITSTEVGYAPPIEVASPIEAPTPRSVSSSSS